MKCHLLSCAMFSPGQGGSLPGWGACGAPPAAHLQAKGDTEELSGQQKFEEKVNGKTFASWFFLSK